MYNSQAAPMDNSPGRERLRIATKEDFLREYGGSSLSYSSLQEGIDVFLGPAYGYIAYSPVKIDFERPLCLADPICAEEDLERLIEMFMQEQKAPVFLHITKKTAEVLSKLGFMINEIGVETIIDVQTFNLVGGGKEFLRSQMNRAAKDGLVIKEQSCSEVPRQLLEEISAEWKTRKVNTEDLAFLVRPAIFDDESDVRKFFAYKDDQLVGFNFFDPIYRDGQIIGYLDNTHRNFGRFSYSIPDCINIEAIRQFKMEGKEILSLGFSALHALNDSGEFRYSGSLKKTLKYFYEHANFLYDFKGAAFHKSRYRPGTEGCEDIKIYLACQSPVPVLHTDKVFKKCGINPIKRMAERGLHWGIALAVPRIAKIQPDRRL
jgi:phosphatidylglycerol lysyltransferase